MFEHDRAEYRQQMGHVWLGFSRAQIEQWLGDGRLRRHRACSALPADPQAKGPALFVAAARRAPGGNGHATVPTYDYGLSRRQCNQGG